MKDKKLEVLNIVLAVIIAALLIFTMCLAKELRTADTLEEFERNRATEKGEMITEGTFVFAKVLNVQVEENKKVVEFETVYGVNKKITLKANENLNIAKDKTYVVYYLGENLVTLK